jgi:hypothetical protein
MTSERERRSQEAIGCLGAAKALRQTRASWVRDAFQQYGDQGSLISGIEREHWPEELKDRLRTNAREIGQAVADAYKCWRKAGRRVHTLRRIAENYRIEGSRY